MLYLPQKIDSYGDQGILYFSASNSHDGLAKNFIQVLLMP